MFHREQTERTLVNGKNRKTIERHRLDEYVGAASYQYEIK